MPEQSVSTVYAVFSAYSEHEKHTAYNVCREHSVHNDKKSG